MELGRIAKADQDAPKIRCTQVESLFLVQLAREVHVAKRRDCLDELVKLAEEIGKRAPDADLSGVKGHPKPEPEAAPEAAAEAAPEAKAASARGHRR